jgi:hypothetical protein
VRNTMLKAQVSLRKAKKDTDTLQKLSRKDWQRKSSRSLRQGHIRFHYVEPERLPADFCEVRKKKYRQLKLVKNKVGFPVPEGLVGSRIVSECAKSTYDTMISTFLLCKNIYNSHEYQIAKRSYHGLNQFVRSRIEFFSRSQFVQQTMVNISILFRLKRKSLMAKGLPLRGIRPRGPLVGSRPLSFGIMD